MGYKEQIPMGEGLKRGLLAAVVSRGPWHIGPGLHTNGPILTLTGAEVTAVYNQLLFDKSLEAVTPNTEIAKILGETSGSAPKVGRCTQLLRKAGLAEPVPGKRAWQPTGGQ